MEEIISKEELNKLMKIKGETRGFNIECDTRWILKYKGEDGLRRVEEELKKMGYPINYKTLKIMDYYPAGLRALSLLAIKKVFNLGREEIREIGALHPKTPLIIKFFIKYFFSVPRIMKEASKMWKKYWTVGEFIPVSYDMKEGYAVVRLKDFNLHPVFCHCLEGYFVTIAELVLKNKKASCEETKCPFRGDKYHEFLVKWK